METFDPSRPDFAPYGFTCVRWHPTRMQRPDRHNEIEMNFLGTGWVTYLLGGRKVRIEAGQLSAFWAALPHQVTDYGDEPEYLRVFINQVRKKIEANPAKPKYILTVPWVGYQFVGAE